MLLSISFFVLIQVVEMETICCRGILCASYIFISREIQLDVRVRALFFPYLYQNI